MSEHIGNHKDLNGDTVRVSFENRRYYYETVDGTPDRYVSHQGQIQTERWCGSHEHQPSRHQQALQGAAQATNTD